jgi:peroxiredoxin family protein
MATRLVEIPRKIFYAIVSRSEGNEQKRNSSGIEGRVEGKRGRECVVLHQMHKKRICKKAQHSYEILKNEREKGHTVVACQ